jgi:hypothetical protein
METVFRKLKMVPLECDHHVRGYVEIDGKKMFATHFSFGRGDIYGRVLKNIIRDLHASEDIFFGLTDCHKDRGDYLSMLKVRQIIS